MRPLKSVVLTWLAECAWRKGDSETAIRLASQAEAEKHAVQVATEIDDYSPLLTLAAAVNQRILASKP